MRCLICGSSELGPLYENVRDRFGVAVGVYRFLGCRDCGSATLEAPPPADGVADLYPRHYTFRRAAERRPGLRAALAALEWRVFYAPTYRRRVAIFRRLTRLARGRLLEVGCGSGLLLAHFRDAGYDVEGVELSAADAAYARECFGLPVLHGSVETAPLESDRYDAVVLINVLEHILDPAAMLSRIREVLRPDGVVVVGVPVIDSAYARLLGARWGAVTEAPRHVSIPSFDGVVRMLRRCGFDDIASAPAPLAERAGDLVLSMLPSAATTMSYGRGTPLGALARRCAAALMMAPALVLALAEPVSWTRPGRTETMLFSGRKTPEGACRVS
jgi:SAM-dependent methyltransferase